VSENVPAQSSLAVTADRLRACNRIIGRSVALLTIVMVIIMAEIVIERYLLNSGSIRLQESIVFMHAAVFMLVAGYTLEAGGHVRVDIFYSRMRPPSKAVVDIAGTLLLLWPFCLFLLWSSWDYVATSWAIQESSRETGGLPFPFPSIVKSFIPAVATLLLIQGAVIILDSVAVIRESAERQRS
jgi:TRAP-type mannitol/chloroaromatic compound transport system permease small subunit